MHSALTSAVRKQLVNTIEEYEAMIASWHDTGQTFVWELFAGGYVVTRIATSDGHVAGQPPDLVMKIDVSSRFTINRVVEVVDKYKPWLLTARFPCDPWSITQELNIARG